MLTILYNSSYRWAMPIHVAVFLNHMLLIISLLDSMASSEDQQLKLSLNFIMCFCDTEILRELTEDSKALERTRTINYLFWEDQ